ncbi:conserved hypothetical protein [Vibrio phage 496E54-1]|nr:conserved hypothetical protein [Vibrio phage 495E54-1]CAH9013880.1 conserved hypothetical protein [Vibrio phage 496E54-1]
MSIYFASLEYKHSGRHLSPFPNLKSLKDWVKDALKEYQEHSTGLEDLSKVLQVKLSDGPEATCYAKSEDVTKWFYESYYGSHANKEQKQWIEFNIFN